MLDAELFDKLAWIASAVRQDTRPFGGIQLLLVGDFLQLPPVTKDGGAPRFCFEARSWGKCIKAHIELQHVFRQKNQVAPRPRAPAPHRARARAAWGSESRVRERGSAGARGGAANAGRGAGRTLWTF